MKFAQVTAEQRLLVSAGAAGRVPPKAPTAYLRARKRALDKLHTMKQAGQVDVLYGDKCGFSLLPCVPYLWQKTKHTLCLLAHSHHKRLSVLGFWCKDNQLWSFPCTGAWQPNT